jgi:hypothetical protein
MSWWKDFLASFLPKVLTDQELERERERRHGEITVWRRKRASEGYHEWSWNPPKHDEPVQLRRFEWPNSSLITRPSLVAPEVNAIGLYWRLWHGEFGMAAYSRIEND